jgi:antirestriction protein ArdC
VQTLRWAEDDRLSSTIRRAYRPWRKPWRSGFDSRHGVPPFDHVTCPSSFAEAATFVALGSQNRIREVCTQVRASRTVP